MNIIIVGGGNVGYYLTKTLLEHGHKAIIIENRKELCQKLADSLDFEVVYGDGTKTEVLQSVFTPDVDAFIAVTGRDENNLIACQLAKKQFDVAKTVARVSNPKNTEILKKLGVDVAISTTSILAHIIERETDDAVVKQIMSVDGGEVTINEITITKGFKYIGYKLRDIPTPKGMIIATVNREGEIIVPDGDTKIFEKDKILFVASNEVVHRAKELYV